jgi:hypothetical protein
MNSRPHGPADSAGQAQPTEIDIGPVGGPAVVLTDVGEKLHWLWALLRYDDCWALFLLATANPGVVYKHRNPQLTSIGDLPSAQRWATLLETRLEDLADLLTGQRNTVCTVGRITEWREIWLGRHHCWVPLFTATDRSRLPFTDLHPATGAHCPRRDLTADGNRTGLATGTAGSLPASPVPRPPGHNIDDAGHHDVAGCPLAAARAARYETPCAGEAAETPLLLSSAPAAAHWVHALLAFTSGCWTVYEPDRCFASVTVAARNDQLRDPGEVAAAQRWAAGYLNGREDRLRACLDPALLAQDPVRRVTEWRPVLVDTVAEVRGWAWLPLFHDTPVCQLPFRGLRAATGSACACVPRGGDQ